MLDRHDTGEPLPPSRTDRSDFDTRSRTSPEARSRSCSYIAWYRDSESLVDMTATGLSARSCHASSDLEARLRSRIQTIPRAPSK